MYLVLIHLIEEKEDRGDKNKEGRKEEDGRRGRAGQRAPTVYYFIPQTPVEVGIKWD